MAVQAANDQRIKFIENKENIGLVQSLNRAISKATGKLLHEWMLTILVGKIV